MCHPVGPALGNSLMETGKGRPCPTPLRRLIRAPEPPGSVSAKKPRDVFVAEDVSPSCFFNSSPVARNPLVGRPVKSILPHIVKGQHRGTRLEKASLKVQALQAAKGKPGHASCRCLYCSGASYLEHSPKYALNVKQSEKYATQCWDRCWWCRCQPQCTHRKAYNTHKCTLI